jgi:hypothetical protein
MNTGHVDVVLEHAQQKVDITEHIEMVFVVILLLLVVVVKLPHLLPLLQDVWHVLVQMQTHVAHQQIVANIRATQFVYRVCYNRFEQSLIKMKDKK